MTTLARGAMVVACLGLASVAQATVIDFDAIGSGALSGTRVEDGFDLAFSSMVADLGSDSTPDVEIEKAFSRDGLLDITRSDGGLFSFASIDWQLEYGDFVSITVGAFRDGQLVGLATFGTASMNYATFGPGSLAGVLMDTLGISAQRDIAGGAFDTVVLTEQSVPEPTSLLLLGTGAVGVVARRRWRKRH